MGMDINETGNAGMKDEMRGTGTNGGVSEMRWKQDGLEDRKGIVEEGRAEWTCRRSIGDRYLTHIYVSFIFKYILLSILASYTLSIVIVTCLCVT